MLKLLFSCWKMPVYWFCCSCTICCCCIIMLVSMLMVMLMLIHLLQLLVVHLRPRTLKLEEAIRF